jgi:hypothetical protein
MPSPHQLFAWLLQSATKMRKLRLACGGGGRLLATGGGEAAAAAQVPGPGQSLGIIRRNLLVNQGADDEVNVADRGSSP